MSGGQPTPTVLGACVVAGGAACAVNSLPTTSGSVLSTVLTSLVVASASLVVAGLVAVKAYKRLAK